MLQKQKQKQTQTHTLVEKIGMLNPRKPVTTIYNWSKLKTELSKKHLKSKSS